MLRVSIRVARTPAQAFDHFTRSFGSWWPIATHSVAGSDAAECGMELYVGGRIWERTAADAQHVWGHVLDAQGPGASATDPPSSDLSSSPSLALSFSWHPGRPPDTAQTVDVGFHSEDSAATEAITGHVTELVLEHGDWHVFGPAAEHAREQYRAGWKLVLERFRHSLEAAPTARSNPSA